MVKKLAVLTSGGDAPGMNAAIRAVVRAGLYYGYEVYGISDGFKGLYEGSIERMHRSSVSEKMNYGGTFLGTARLKSFREVKVLEAAHDNLWELGINSLVVIGGDGTYRGAVDLSKHNINCIGIPCTIDNDIVGTDYAIGFDTALNTVVEAVDKLRDTSNSHRRCSIIEVMGRNCGAIAMWTGIAVGAEIVITKETGLDIDAIVNSISEAAKFKRHAIVIVAENMIKIDELEKIINKRTPFDSRATILGHVQRGGKPTARDRVLASTMGVKAVEALEEGKMNSCVCLRGSNLEVVPFEEAFNDKRSDVEEKYRNFKILW